MNLETKVKDYEGNPFKGPCSIAINKENEVLYICDSGYFGTTCLNRPNASLYIYDLETNVIKPLLQNCLAYASDLVYDYNRGCLYVAETFANRIFRLEQNPIGVYSATHFYQFSGRVGPTALAIDNNGYLFVGRFEFQNKDKEEVDGLISVINPDGVLVGELVLAKMPEITGLYISFEKIDYIYVTEKCSNSVLRIKISNFMQEVLLSEENSRNIN
jgi:sugar lactone lactonase YvrE